MKLASIILDIPTQALDTPYTYLVPDDTGEMGGYEITVGCAVLVPFGPRQAVGFVVAIDGTQSTASQQALTSRS